MFKLKTEEISDFNKKYSNMMNLTNSVFVPTDIIHSYYTLFDKSILTESEASILDSVYESLTLIADNLDYRDSDYEQKITTLKTFITESVSKHILVQPLELVLNYIDNSVCETHNHNCNTAESNNTVLGIDSGLDSARMQYIYESDYHDFLFEMKRHNLIPDTIIDTYSSKMQMNLLRASDRIEDMRKGVSESVLTGQTHLDSSPREFVRFPNEQEVSSLFHSMITGGDHMDSYLMESILYRTIDELSKLDNSEIYSGFSRDFACIWNDKSNYYKANMKLQECIESCEIPCYETTMCLETCYILCDLIHLNSGEGSSIITSSLKRVILEMINSRTSDELSVPVVENEDLHNSLLAQLNSKYKLSVMMETYLKSENSPVWGVERLEEPWSTNSREFIENLLESFQILKDGTIRVTITPQSTFMNEYATNHRLLMENYRMKDYEAMRYNLVYHLILIDSIEKNVLHNDKVSKDSELYIDATRARMQAKTDVSRYLPEVKRHVKDFDLNQFYQQVQAEKNTIEIDTVSTISGAKNIIKSILL